MNRTELRKRALAAVPPFYRRTMGKFDTKIARILVDATLDSIMNATLEGERVEIHGFGTLDTSVRKPHLVYCNLGSDPKYKVTRPYVRVFLRPCASWKTKLSDQVKDQFTDQLEQKQQVAAQRSKKQGGTDGEVRL